MMTPLLLVCPKYHTTFTTKGNGELSESLDLKNMSFLRCYPQCSLFNACDVIPEEFEYILCNTLAEIAWFR
jgi:hypothetical protein